MKLTLISFLMMLNEGHICWANAKYQTDHILAQSDIECLKIPLTDEAYKCVEDLVIDYLALDKEENGE